MRVVGPFRVTVAQEKAFFCTSATRVLPAAALALTVHFPATNWAPLGVRLVVGRLADALALEADSAGPAVAKNKYMPFIDHGSERTGVEKGNRVWHEINENVLYLPLLNTGAHRDSNTTIARNGIDMVGSSPKHQKGCEGPHNYRWTGQEDH